MLAGIKKPLLLLLLLSLLAACSSQPLPPPAQEELLPNAELWHWRAQGRLAIKTPNDGQTLNLDWQQDGYSYQLQIFGPLGQGSARLDGRPFYVTLVTSDGQTLQAASPEQLLRQGLGLQLPLSNMVYWIRGLPAPGPYQQLNTSSLLQDGWQLEWRRFTQVEERRLPALLVANQGDLEIRLAIHSWQLFSSNEQDFAEQP
ncbi:lipoprotein insertase outer membrane protein LolB [Marinospirillum perlucidum]|uniref:lipoprotein insertase outer membrane protein LolB n=1 Tax=Marinospirillum perlucidum TaxID=1982602 RepID=UPI000DF14FA2|nr:lipoprotein insertase outer membrane protein LolB [Marinospirillum perlucidum]